uniref:Uncharacterized protein n=1 Tax=Romanomermis culicivorax TaxID=13658 RepID=A0A915IXT4_ROMCU
MGIMSKTSSETKKLLSQVRGALVRLEYGSIWRSLEGVLRFCFVCNVVKQEQQTNISRKIRSRPESSDSNSLSCDRDGYANGSFNMSHTVTSGLISLRLISWDNLTIEKNFRFVSTELLVNLTPNDRCGRIKQLICQFDLNYDRFNFYSKIKWKFNDVPLKRSLAKIYREGISILSIRKPGNYVCIVETLFNMAETREIIRDENYAFILISENCLALSVQKKDSGTYSTSKTASISPRSVNIERPKSPPISTKSKSKTST